MISSWKPCRVVPFAGGSNGEAGRASGRALQGGGLVAGRQMDVSRRSGRRPLPLVAPALSRRPAGTDHLRLQPGRRYRHGARRPVAHHFHQHAAIRRLDPRRPRRPRAFYRRLRGSSAAGLFPRRQAPLLFVASRFARIARRTVARRSRIRNKCGAGAGRFDVANTIFLPTRKKWSSPSSPPAKPPKYGLRPWIAARPRTGFPRAGDI